MTDRDVTFMSRLPRWMHRLYARLDGYFWTPCPLCRRRFGGHEWKERDGLSATITTATRVNGGRSGTAICPSCTRAGRGDPEWAAEWVPADPAPTPKSVPAAPPETSSLSDVDSFELGRQWMEGDISKDAYFAEVIRRNKERRRDDGPSSRAHP